MLQQTQVATVTAYYQRFLSRFPTISALAGAEETDVLRQWEGLGYYRRARQLHAAAKRIVAEHGGRFPRDLHMMEKLPGIGRYTAGAIASIAFDVRAPILEANTVRLHSRLLGFRGDPTSVPGQRLLWRFAEAILPKRGSGDLNQALMELGSLICTPRAPCCEACPVRSLCPTQIGGWQDVIPAPKRKTKFENVREAAVVVRRSGKVLLRKRSDGERWAGLWDFVRFPLCALRGDDLTRELSQKVYEQVGVKIQPGQLRTTIQHAVTRFRITLECFECAYLSGATTASRRASMAWVTPCRLGEYPLSASGRKLAVLIASWGVLEE